MSLPATSGECFLGYTLFRASPYGFVTAGRLAQGSEIIASSGQTIRVKEVSITPLAEQDLVELSTISAGLKVSKCHRVMVQRGSSPQTIPAGNLRFGDPVYISGDKVEKLIDVRNVLEWVELVSVTFEPDETVEAFHPAPASILSKGHGFPKTSRRSTRRSTRRGTSADVRSSIPDTDDGWQD
ncbi:unnamed protein product [Prorocentrum cordatum]|uniref:Uncharacterized protein n=1 Tax=Prorocentrum cordatum TaxID=2364126 RepID=A0ABN9S404_9DINO|nr:unnamed protein product [Polarella glacialis]